MPVTKIRAESQINNSWSGGSSFFLRTDGSSKMEGNLDLDSNKITGLSDPTSSSDATNKTYVDSVAQGLDVKRAVRLATNGNIDLNNVGSSTSVDNTTVDVDDRILVKNQTDATENGIYTVESSGWVRSDDANQDDDIVSGMFMFVTEGDINGDTGWVLVSNGSLSIGLDSLDFSQFATVQSIIAGDGLEKVNPRTINILLGDDSLRFNNGELVVNGGNGIDTMGDVSVRADTGINVTQGGVSVDYSDGITDSTNSIMVDPNEDMGVTVDNNGVATKVTNGLEFDIGGSISVVEGDGITVDTGVSVQYSDGIGISSGSIVVDADEGITVSTDGVSVDTNSAAGTIDVDVDGVRVSDSEAGELLIGQGSGVNTEFVSIGGDVTIDQSGSTTVETSSNIILSTGTGIQIIEAPEGKVMVGQATGEPDFVDFRGHVQSVSSNGDVDLDPDKVLLDEFYEVSVTPLESPDGAITTFTFPDNIKTETEMIFVNGILQTRSDDYNHTNPNEIVFNYAPMPNDIIRATYFVVPE